MEESFLEKLKEIQHELKTQDNRITSDPIFLVQEKERIYGIDTDFLDDDKIIWYHCDGVEADEDEKASLDDLEESGKDIDDCWDKVGYIEKYRTIQTFFTEKAAQNFIDRNKHRYEGKLSIYVESLYRNPEMRLIRDFILSL